ncbi:AAA family ATPase [Aquihabitans daechungensis]|uniref:AAA family ATPase n=1 Tax=Aquihabitans daechungensis TaxID=1052257 RepID=UPI003B9DD0F5
MGELTEADRLAAALRSRVAETAFVLVGIDGRSGSGKSTLAAGVAAALAAGPPAVAAVVIDGDGFYAGGTAARWDRRSAEEKAAQVIDWRRQRAVLEGLRSWGVATWHAFDWDAADWDQEPPPFASDPITIELAPVVVLEGAYSCRPELHDLLDLRVLVEVPPEVRRQRLLDREGDEYRTDWEGRWSEAEDHYFGTVMPAARFDLVLSPT